MFVGVSPVAEGLRRYYRDETEGADWGANILAPDVFLKLQFANGESEKAVDHATVDHATVDHATVVGVVCWLRLNSRVHLQWCQIHVIISLISLRLSLP